MNQLKLLKMDNDKKEAYMPIVLILAIKNKYITVTN